MTRTNATDLKDVWQTPPEIIEMLGDITLDPCAGPDTEIGDTNFTESDDGLSQSWHGDVFVNPPFSEKEDWLAKSVAEANTASTKCVYVLTPDSTDTKSWWHKYIAQHADYIWFSEGRISYINPETGEPAGSPTFGTAISVFGEPDGDVLTRMSERGQLVKNVSFA